MGAQISSVIDGVVPQGKDRVTAGQKCVSQAILRQYSHGETALHRAARQQGLEDLQQLCSYVQQHWEDVRTQTAQRGSLARGLQRGPMQNPGQNLLQSLINQPNSRGQSPLHVALEAGNTEAALLLLKEMDACPWVQDRMGRRTALHSACIHSLPDVIHMLGREERWAVSPTDHSTRLLEAQTVSGFTALHFAVGDADALRALLHYNPRLTAASTYASWEHGMNYPAGTTALHIAAATGNLNTACILMCHYALHIHGNGRNGDATPDPRLYTNCHGLTPWRIAKDLHFTKLAQVLHPSYPLRMFVLDSPTCPSLQSLAAAVLKQHLLTSIQAAHQPQNSSNTHVACSSLGSNSSCSSLSSVTASSSSSSAAAASQEEEEACCNICFDATPTLHMVGCQHRMCAGCARQLCAAISTEPSRCPFCRSAISGFTTGRRDGL